MHYTWSAIISDKTGRSLETTSEVRRDLELVGAHTTASPWDADKEFQLQDKKRIQKSQYEVLEKMVDIFNRTSARQSKMS